MFVKLDHGECVDLKSVKPAVRKKAYTSLLAQHQVEDATIDIAVSWGCGQ